MTSGSIFPEDVLPLGEGVQKLHNSFIYFDKFDNNILFLWLHRNDAISRYKMTYLKITSHSSVHLIQP